MEMDLRCFVRPSLGPHWALVGPLLLALVAGTPISTSPSTHASTHQEWKGKDHRGGSFCLLTALRTPLKKRKRE